MQTRGAPLAEAVSDVGAPHQAGRRSMHADTFGSGIVQAIQPGIARQSCSGSLQADASSPMTPSCAGCAEYYPGQPAYSVVAPADQTVFQFPASVREVGGPNIGDGPTKATSAKKTRAERLVERAGGPGF
eukprot:6460807-Amphidinium_carterae.1